MWRDLNFSLHRGQLIAVRGDNGRGKSTLLRALAGLYSSWQGELVLFDNGSPVYLGHEAGLKPSLSARENLRWLCRLSGDADKGGATVGRVLKKMNLTQLADTPLSTLSAGQLQRVVLARLLLLPSSLWLLDEPFRSLDGGGIALLNRLLRDHIAGGGAAVIALPAADSQRDGALIICEFQLPVDDASAAGQIPQDSQSEPRDISTPVPLIRFFTALRRDLKLVLTGRGGALRVPLFVLLATLLLYLSEGSDVQGLSGLAPGILWSLALLALLGHGDELSRGDCEDGSLQQLILVAGNGLLETAVARIFSLWIAVVIPLALFLLLCGSLLALPAAAFATLAGSLLVGGLALAALATVGSALLAPIRGGVSLLLPLLMLPLALPILIFGVASVEIALQNFTPLPTLAILLAMALLALLLLPFAITTAWRLAVDH